MAARLVTTGALLWIVRAGLALILLTPFVVTPSTVFPFVVGKALYSRSLIEIVFVAWVLLALVNPSYRPPRSRLLVLLGAALAVAVLAACFGVSVQRSFWSTYERMQGVIDQAHWLALAVVLASVLRTGRDWRILLALNLAAATGVALLATAEHLLATGQGYVRPFTYGEGMARVAATLGNPIFLGAYLQVNVTIALGFLAHSFTSAAGPGPRVTASARVKSGKWFGGKASPPKARQRRRRLSATRAVSRSSADAGAESRRAPFSGPWPGRCLCMAAATAGLWALMLTASRGPFLGLVAGLGSLAVAYLFLARARGTRLVAAGSAGLLGLAAVLVVALSFSPAASRLGGSTANPLAARLAGSGHTLLAVRNRLSAWQAAVRGFVDRPVLGWGPENYVVVLGRHGGALLAEEQVHDHAHSKLLEELATKGLPGLLSYLALWGFAFHVVVRAARRMDARERVPVLFAGAALMGHFVQSLTSPEAAVGSLQSILLLAFVARQEPPGQEPAPAGERDARVRSPIPVPAGAVSRLVGHRGVRVLLVAGTAALAGAGLFAHYAVYSAAGAVNRAFIGVSHPGIPPGRTRRYFEQSIAGFGPLANFPRFALFRYATMPWKYHRARHPVEAGRLLSMVGAEAVGAVESEPGNWRIHEALARFYAVVGVTDPEYRDVARRYLDRTLALAPYKRDMPPPAARFDVYLEGGRLVYVKRLCVPADTEPLFFLHVTPADVDVLPDRLKKHGFHNLDFYFDRRGVVSDGECRVTADLPKYAIRSVNTGQSTLDVETGNRKEVWSEKILFWD